MKFPWEDEDDATTPDPAQDGNDDSWLKSLGQSYAGQKAKAATDSSAEDAGGGVKPQAPQDNPEAKAGMSLGTPEAAPQPVTGNALQQLSKAKTTDRMFMTGAPEAEGHTIKKRGELAGYAGIANFVSDVIKYAASMGAAGAAAGAAGGAAGGAGAAGAAGGAAGGAAAGGAGSAAVAGAGYTSAAGATGVAPIAGSGASTGAAGAAGGGSSFGGDFMNGVMGREGSGGYGEMLGQKTREAALNQLGGGGGGGGGGEPPDRTGQIEAERQAAQKGGPMGAGSAVKAGTAYLKDRKMQALGLKDPSQYLSGGYDLWA